MNEIITSQAVKTMTTREVAKLIEKEHGNIKISAERLAEKGVIGTLAAQEFTHNGNTYTEYLLCKRDSLILVAQNCPEFTARIVDRWQELEEQATKPAAVLPDFTNPAIAARAWADQVEKVQLLAVECTNQQKQLEVAKPKAEALDRMSASLDAVTFTEAAKLLGVKRNDLTILMHANAWVYRQNGSWVAYDQHIKSGCLQYKEAKYTDEKTGLECRKPYCHVTPKGLTKLALMLGAKISANDSRVEQAA